MGNNPDIFLLNKTKAILKNKKKFKPIVYQKRPPFRNNGASNGCPRDDLEAEISKRNQGDETEITKSTPVKETTQVAILDPSQNGNSNFYDNIPSPILNT